MALLTYQDKYNELVSAAITSLKNRTDISQLAPGAKARALLEIVMREISSIHTAFTTDLLEAFVRYATAEKLDFIGELFGISRIEASRNVVDSTAKVQKFYVDSGTFGTINGGSSFEISVGTEIESRDTLGGQPVKYVLASSVLCSAAETEAYGSIRSVEFGDSTNVGAGTLVKHNFSLYTDYLNDSLKTINVEGIAYAQERESDENYRYRIINQSLAGEQANTTAVRMAALTIPGVADVFMDEFGYGIGTGAVYIKAVTPTVSEFLLSNVQIALDRVKAYGILAKARAPKPVGVELEITLNLYKPVSTTEQETLKQEVRDRLFTYINSLDINQALEPDLLVRVIQSTNANIRNTGTLTRPIDHLYIWKYSAAEDNRVSRELLSGYQAQSYERIVVEYTALPDSRDPIRIKVK